MRGYNIVGLAGLKTHRETVTVSTKDFLARIFYAWAFETIWAGLPPIKTYPAGSKPAALPR